MSRETTADRTRDPQVNRTNDPTREKDPNRRDEPNRPNDPSRPNDPKRPHDPNRPNQPTNPGRRDETTDPKDRQTRNQSDADPMEIERPIRSEESNEDRDLER